MFKLHFFAKSLLLAAVLFSGVVLCHAQTLEYLNSNNINAGIGIGGNLFSDSIPIATANLFQTKFDSGRSEVYTAALWMHAVDELGAPRGAGEMTGEFGKDYFDGPIVAVYDTAYDRYYKRVFKVTQTQIANFRALSFPVQSAQVDPAILYWPGAGNPSVINDFHVNINAPLAPFKDLNNNGIYEPLLGDYPGVCGDQGIFFVFNDIRASHTECDCNPLGVEIRGLASSFTDSSNNLPYNKRAVNNSIFIHYEIENKSVHNYSGFNLGHWLDPDIGCFNNDYVGCDSLRNLMFGYNGVAFDPDCSPELGYHGLPVALGVQLLNVPLDVFGTWGNINPPAESDPVTVCGRYENYLIGLWADDSPFEYGGNGYGGNGGVTKYLFSGDPNDTAQWSEVSIHASPCDRQIYGSTNLAGLPPGQIIDYDIAYTTSFDASSNYIAIVDTLKNDADVVRSFYNNQILPCQSQFTTAVHEIAPGQISASIYPNPANDRITIIAGDNIKSLELMDIQGRVLLAQPVGAKAAILPVSNLAKGVYLVNIQCTTGGVVKRIVVE